MTRLHTAAVFAIGLSSLSARQAVAQVTVEPASPRWGETVTITARPNPADTEAQRVNRHDQLYVSLGATDRGISTPFRPWAPTAWDGAQFVARMTLPPGCLSGFAWVATAERQFDFRTNARPFVCRTPDGTFPPGALISGLEWGGRDTANWKATSPRI